MPKSEKELNELKLAYQNLASKLLELNDDELKEVCGGDDGIIINGLEAIGPYASSSPGMYGRIHKPQDGDK